MSENNREDIQNLEYSYIGLISQKIKIGIIGAGKAGLIKARYFLRDKCPVYILSETFSEDILKLEEEYKNITLIKESYTEEFLKDKHIILIAVNNEDIINSVKRYCEENCRIYINCTDFKNGMGIVPVKVQSKNMIACINSTKANPKGVVMVSKKIKNVLEEYDDFIEYTGVLRNRAKKNEKYKKIIIDTISNEEFKKSFDDNKAEKYLREHLSKDAFKFIFEE